MSDLLTLSLDCDCPLIESGLPSQRLVEVVVTAMADPNAARRTPLNLALVIDRSGSMSGEKLAFAQQAACHALDRLDVHDRVAVVAYDDQVRLLSPGVAVSDGARAELKRQINALRPGGQTDLGGGWLRGAQEVATGDSLVKVSRVLLLTDGLANVGITDREELTRHARELAQRGVATTTLGLGTDYDHELLEAMATEGGGHYYFIGHPRDIPGHFAQELGEMLTVVARETTLSVDIPAGVAIDLLNDLPHERAGGVLRLFLRDMFAGESKAFYLKALTPPGALGSALTLRARLSFATCEGRHQSVEAAASFRYGDGVGDAPRNRGLQERASDVEMSAATSRALKLEREGRRQEAAALMRRSLAAAAPCLPAPAAAAYAQAAAEIGEGLTDMDRKTRHDAAYRRKNSR